MKDFWIEVLARCLGTSLGILLCFCIWWFLLGGKNHRWPQ